MQRGRVLGWRICSYSLIKINTLLALGGHFKITPGPSRQKKNLGCIFVSGKRRVENRECLAGTWDGQR